MQVNVKLNKRTSDQERIQVEEKKAFFRKQVCVSTPKCAEIRWVIGRWLFFASFLLNQYWTFVPKRVKDSRPTTTRLFVTFVWKNQQGLHEHAGPRGHTKFSGVAAVEKRRKKDCCIHRIVLVLRASDMHRADAEEEWWFKTAESWRFISCSDMFTETARHDDRWQKVTSWNKKMKYAIRWKKSAYKGP